MKWLTLIAFVYKGRYWSFVTYHPSNKPIGLFIGCETIYCNLNSNMVEDVGCPVLAARQRHGSWNSLPMLRLFGGPPKLMGHECKRIRKEVPYSRLAGPKGRIQYVSLGIYVTNCVPRRGYTITDNEIRREFSQFPYREDFQYMHVSITYPVRYLCPYRYH